MVQISCPIYNVQTCHTLFPCHLFCLIIIMCLLSFIQIVIHIAFTTTQTKAFVVISTTNIDHKYIHLRIEIWSLVANQACFCKTTTRFRSSKLYLSETIYLLLDANAKQLDQSSTCHNLHIIHHVFRILVMDHCHL